MPQIVPGGLPGGVGQGSTAKAGVQAQLDAMASAMRQLVGNANIVRGSTESSDPLTPPFTLYVNPYIGRDTFAAGAYNSFESSGTDEEKIAQKLKRLSNQQLTCGYSANAPFKTINRAIIEAAIVTSRDYFTFTDPRAQVDCVLIRLSAGRHIVYNQPGNTAGAITPAAWADGFVPTVNHLIAFNPPEGGLIIPRAASFNGDDLRKCVLSPDYVPVAADEAADYSNRSAILRPTPLALGGQLTFVDKIGATTSHHLLDCFAYVSQTQLNTFYTKVYTSCGTGAGLGLALMAARPTEYNTVGDFAGSPDATWDTTGSASPYIFNASIRSDYGLCGIFADGDKVGGLKSLVTAQFTGVALQKDITCWEIYDAGTWRTPVNYAELVDASPDDTRKKPARRSWHITAVNDAFIQGVSEFNVGQEGCRTDNGGEITLTNSNSSFGGCAGLSNGYKRAAFPFDKNWAVASVVVPVSPSEKVGNIRKIQLGKLLSYNTSPNRLTLESGLQADPANPAQPLILSADGYSFVSGTQIWIENPSGPDYRAVLSASAWASGIPDRILVAAAPVDSATGAAIDLALLIGKRVYVRRLADTRSPAERRCSLEISNTASARIPERNFVLQTDPPRANGAISRVLNATTELLMVTAAGSIAGPGVRDANITIRRGAPSVTYAADTYYPAGTIVKSANKHYQRLVTGVSAGSTPNETEWGETLVHMPSSYNAEESRLNESLVLTFDTDTSTDEDSTTLGINWNTIFTASGAVRNVYRASSDYRGAHAFLVALGLSDANAHTALLPRSAATRRLDPTSATDFPTAPSGGAATGRGNWAIEFRRPSVLRMYGHAWEWAGFGGYSKALPRVQQTLSPYNKFTYYFTSANGGRVVPTGSNEDGFAVSSRGLEDIETGQQLSVNNLDSPELDAPTELTDLSVDNLTVSGTLDVSGVTVFEGGDAIAMRTDRFGVGKLADIAQLTATASSPAFDVASTDSSLNGAPDLVTIGGLNRWRQAQKLISADTSTVTIFVESNATDRNLDAMFNNPPTSAAAAIPTLARAAEYVNAIIGSGNQTAEIRIAPGLYDPSSVWQCNVLFVAYNATLTAPIWASNSTGVGSTPNNYFDGSGWDNFSAAVNFWIYRLVLRPALQSGDNLDISMSCRTMRFYRSVSFSGGFHCLGLAETIKSVGAGLIPSASFLGGVSPAPALADYTSDLTTNVDTLISRIRVLNGRNPTFRSVTLGSFIVIRSAATDTVNLNDLVIGPGLPSYKDDLNGPRDPLIAVASPATINVFNIYIRGKTRITSAGMGVTNAIALSGSAHYGSAQVTAPWFWEQTHHTFIGGEPQNFQPITIDFGNNSFFLVDSAIASGRNYYQDGSGKFLPNHIHLLTNTGTVPSDNTAGPFFDQFIHAPVSFQVNNLWQAAFQGSNLGLPWVQGFVGKFGSNAHNATKTRGVLGGNATTSDPETGFTFSILSNNDANNGRSIFQRAGIPSGASSATAKVTFDALSTAPGDGFPAGLNPVITTDTSGSVALNVGLRSYLRGISVNNAITIPATNIIL